MDEGSVQGLRARWTRIILLALAWIAIAMVILKRPFPDGMWAAMLAYGWAVVALRCAFLRSTVSDRRMNATLACEIGWCTLISPMAQHTLTAPLAYLLGIVVVSVGLCAPFTLVAADWLGRPLRARTVYVASALTAIALLAFDIPALRHGATPLDYPGWTPFAFWLVYAMPLWWGGAYTARAWLVTVRGKPGRCEAAVYAAFAALFIIALTWSIAALLNATFLAFGRRTGMSTFLLTESPSGAMYIGFSLAVLLACPVVTKSMEQFGLDRWSRRRKMLLPLWTDLTSVCPEVVHVAPTFASDHHTRYLLHRTVVEIRDSIRLLSPFTPLDLEPAGPANETLSSAMGLARAVEAKACGTPASGAVAAPSSMATDLLAEADELTRLARIWPHAKTIAYSGKRATAAAPIATALSRS